MNMQEQDKRWNVQFVQLQHEFVLLDDREVFEGENISFRFRVTCSKGTYVRTLAVMIGEKLGFHHICLTL